MQKDFVGRADILLENLEISKSVKTFLNTSQIIGIKEKIRSQFEPSLLRMTVAPSDPDSFNGASINSSKFQVISGRHLFVALTELNDEGYLEGLKTLQDKKVTCYILKTASSLIKNYSNVRLKDLESQFCKRPEIDQLLPIHLGLIDEVGEEDSRKAVLRYADSLAFQQKDKDSLKKMLYWPSREFKSLVEVLTLYRTYRTADSKTSENRSNKNLKFGNLFH